MPMPFLRPVANRVASKVASAPPLGSAEEHRGVVDGDLAHLGVLASARGQAAGGRGQRALLDEGLGRGGHPDQLLTGDELGEVDDVRADVAQGA